MLSVNVLSVPSAYAWTVSAASPDVAMYNLSDFNISLNGKPWITQDEFLKHTVGLAKSSGSTLTVAPLKSATSPISASEIAATINTINKGISAETISDRPGSQTLIIRTSVPFTDQKLKIIGLIPSPLNGQGEADQSAFGSKAPAKDFAALPKIGQNFVYWLNSADVNRLANDKTRVSVRLSNGSIFDLYSGSGLEAYSWTYLSDRSNLDPGPMVVIQVSKDPGAIGDLSCPLRPQVGQSQNRVYGSCPRTCEKDWFAGVKTNTDVKGAADANTSADAKADLENSYGSFCSASFLMVRQKVDFTASNSILPGIEENYIGIKTDKDGKLEVNPTAFAGGDFMIDEKVSVSSGPNGNDVFKVDPGPEDWVIDWVLNPVGCRPVARDSQFQKSITMRPPRNAPDIERNNGIVVGAAKIFDVHALQKMLNDTANQLASMSLFNGAQIGTAVGTLQGVSRDASYVNGQIGTAPTSALTQFATAGSTSPNTVQTTTPIGGTSVVLQCPDGSLPTIGSSTTLGGCAVIPVTGTAANVPAYAVITPSSAPNQGILTTNPAGSAITNTGTTGTVQNSTTTTMGSVSGVAPAAIASTALSAPSNIAVASSDILAEQVQLNAQLIGYKLLLQGALSDQYLAKNSTAVGMRRQTTLGFTVNLDPPRQFKHAVAEIRIVIVPPAGPSNGESPVSLMTLLPVEKTYNVAKVTSHQSAFGGGAVVEPVSFGLSAGKSKDRLYLAKDTDTLAFQFHPAAPPLRTPFPLAAHNELQKLASFETLSPCEFPDSDLPSQALVFGWQFRPVLGEEYVTGGQRQVFAQLALPVDLQGQYVPAIRVQTRWRDYDRKSQTVGAVFKDSCSETTDQSGVMLANKPHVDELEMSDLGGGLVSLTARGQFYSSSLGILAGANVLAPRSFDGRSLGLVASAHDLLLARNLYILDSNGTASPFGMIPNPNRSCGLSDATMKAVPYPDGNSRSTLQVSLGSDFNLSPTGDHYPRPLVMVGDSVYGLKETPYLAPDGGGLCYQFIFGGTTSPKGCSYQFIAPTTALRNAQTFLTSELTWSDFSESGRISFAPSFTALAVASAAATDAKGNETGSTLYSVSGFDLSRLQLPCANNRFGDSLNPCLQVNIGGKSLKSEEVAFTLESNNQATMTLSKDQLGKAKAVRFLLYWDVIHHKNPPAPDTNDPENSVEWSLSIPKAETTPITPSPSYLFVGDSRTVSFSGGELCTTTKDYSATFEGVALKPTPTCNGTSLSVAVTTAITKLPGTKELTLSTSGIPVTSGGKPIKLSFDVLKH